MTSIIIGTHGKLGEELLNTAEMIIGKQSNVGTVSFMPNQGLDELTTMYKTVIDSLDTSKGLIFLVDVYGGSPFNAASKIAFENENMDIVTGVNMPMLLESMAARDNLTTEELIDLLKNSGSKGIVSFKESFSKDTEINENEEEL